MSVTAQRIGMEIGVQEIGEIILACKGERVMNNQSATPRQRTQAHSTETAEVGMGSEGVGASRIALSIAAASLMSLGFDLFLHGGVLARLYMVPGRFLLGPEDAFRRIPLGYLAFLLLTAALYWLLRRLGVRGAVEGSRYGAAAGAVMWGAFTVGLYSISTATLPLLAGWWIGQTVELGLAGAVLGAALNGAPLRRIWSSVAIAVVLCLVATVAMQSLGWAPAAKMAQ